MRKTILIIVQIAIVVLLLQTSYAKTFFAELASTVSNWYESIVEVPERSKIVKLRDRFMRNNMSLKPYQTDYVIEVTDSAEKINQFYKLYCVKKDANPYIFGPNLAKFCLDIERSELLYEISI